MTQTLQIPHLESLINKNSSAPKNWFIALLTGKVQEYNRTIILKKVKYWWVDIDFETNSINRQIGFNSQKAPMTGLNNEKLNIDIIKQTDNKTQIDRELFNDMWNQFDRRDFDSLKTLLSKYLKTWKRPNGFDSPTFPAIIIDLDIKKDVIRIDKIEDLINQSDFVGYEWADSERLIDLNGNIYKTTYYNFGHPVGVVIPEKIEQRITNSVLMEYLGKDKIDFKIME